MTDPEFKINGADAYANYGLTLGDTSLAALMSPPPMKDYITNKSPLLNGTAVVTDTPAALPMVDEREVQITLYLHAANRTKFNERYAAFVTLLQKGVVTIETKYQPGVVYRLLFLSVNQYSEYNGRLGKFVVRFNEPDPTNRTADDND